MLRTSAILIACAILFVSIVPATLLPAAPILHLPAGVNPASLRYTTFAQGLNFPTGMLQLSDGSMLVATTNTPSAGGNFYNSANSGALLRLVDANNDGVADGPGTNLAPAGLQGSITSLKQAGELLFVNQVSSAGHRITVLRQGATPSNPFTSVGVIDLTYSASNALHKTYALETRPTPGQAGNYDLFFNIGSEFDAANSTSPVSLSGLVTASGLLPESIYKTTVSNLGGTPSFSAPSRIASGLRNSAGLDIHPTTGDLWFQDNGIDGPNSDSFGPAAFSADELNVVPFSEIGGAVNDFGFAGNYMRSDGVQVGTATQVAAFLPIPGVGQSEGANEIAIVPSAFPTGFNNGVLVGFHGQFSAGGLSNDENSLVYYDFATQSYMHIIRALEQSTVGHLDGLLSTNNSVFISDLASTGALFGVPTGPGTGIIYQLQVVPEPSTLFMATAIGGVLVACRRLHRGSVVTNGRNRLQ